MAPPPRTTPCRLAALALALLDAACTPPATATAIPPHVAAGETTPAVAASQDAPPAAEGPAATDEPAAPADVADALAPPVDAPPPDTLPWPVDCPPWVKAQYAGSWSWRAEDGFDRTWFDEAGLLAIPKSRLAGRRKWQGVQSDGDVMLVDVRLGRPEPAMAYVWALVTWDEIVGPPAEPVPAVIHLRHRGRIRVWLDGELLVDEPPAPDGEPRTIRRAVHLTGSDDVLLAKVGRGNAQLGPTADFELRVSTPAGERVDGQIWQTVRVW